MAAGLSAKAGAAAVLAFAAASAFATPDLGGVTLPPGFKIEVWTDQVPLAREIALGDKGTVFVGSMRFGGTVADASVPDSLAMNIVD